MNRLLFWIIALLLNPPREAEMTESLAPPGWQGNFWGPAATKGRREGTLPPIVATPQMARWDQWGRKVLHEGDIVFRLGDARIGRGYFPMSRFLARASNSPFSHTGIVAIEEEGPVVYDTTRLSISRQPFCVWVLDNVGSIGVKRLRPEYRSAIPKVLAYCRKVFKDQVPFDYQLSDDDEALYCVEMTEKAFRSAGIELSKPIRLGRHGASVGFSAPDVRYPLRLELCPATAIDVRPACFLSRERASWNLGVQVPDDRGAADVCTGAS